MHALVEVTELGDPASVSPRGPQAGLDDWVELFSAQQWNPQDHSTVKDAQTGQILDGTLVAIAREEEMKYFESKRVWIKVPGQEALTRTGRKPSQLDGLTSTRATTRSTTTEAGSSLANSGFQGRRAHSLPRPRSSP